MLFFRTESYKFPHIEAVLESQDRGLTLRFFGASRPAIALYFSLVDIDKAPLIKEGRFFGSLPIGTDEVKIGVNLFFKDKSGNELDEKSFYNINTDGKKKGT